MKEKTKETPIPTPSVKVMADGEYLIVMTKDDLRSLLTMIKGACLPERRTFNSLKEQIEKILL